MAGLYNQISYNKRKTWALITAFLLLIIAIGWYLSYVFNNVWILIIAVFWSVISSFASYWYSDKIVLSLTRARQLKKEDNPVLFRIVENLSITAGLLTPRIYIMEELQPNAFATGRDEKHSAVVVTRGLLNKLNKVELEGVIAHELSHIKNRDILLQTVVVVLAGTISIIADIFLRILFYGNVSIRSDDSEGSQSAAIIFLISLLFIALAWFASLLIKASISRKREFLADANGVLLTRYPEGLISALEKISADGEPMEKVFSSTAHLFISSPFKGKKSNFITKMFMTHPPVEERIKALREMRF